MYEPGQHGMRGAGRPPLPQFTLTEPKTVAGWPEGRRETVITILANLLTTGNGARNAASARHPIRRAIDRERNMQVRALCHDPYVSYAATSAQLKCMNVL